MSDSDHHTAEPAGHESPIKTPKQLIATVIAAFILPVLIIVLLVSYVDFGSRDGAGGNDSPEAITKRIAPVATVAFKDASAPTVAKTGEQVFTAQCSACHATGAAGSPKFGDQAAWAPRIKTGYETLLHAALKGMGAMPPQSGGELSDYEIARGVVYMANKAGANFAEPKAPEAAASAASGAEAAAPAASAAGG